MRLITLELLVQLLFMMSAFSVASVLYYCSPEVLDWLTVAALQLVCLWVVSRELKRQYKLEGFQRPP